MTEIDLDELEIGECKQLEEGIEVCKTSEHQIEIKKPKED